MNWELLVTEKAPDGEIAGKLVTAIQSLFTADKDLLKLDANERSISHRLALHMTFLFNDYDVDCEYNRDKRYTKTLRKLIHPDSCTQNSETDGSRVYPDIIVHRRDTSENLLVIEIKKSTSNTPDGHDLKKLRLFRKELRYKFAVFLQFLCSSKDPDLEKVKWI